ncbi:N-acetyltransferase aca1 [Schizosaccharomyces pombe]
MKDPNTIPPWRCTDFNAWCIAVDKSTNVKNKEELLSTLTYFINYEIEMGQTYPIDIKMTRNEAEDFFFKFCTVICVPVESETSPAPDLATASIDWKTSLLGAFYIKPNYPGRCSHICNGGFLVSPSHRSKGIGRNLANAYLYFAPRIGYKSSVFNLVFATNIKSIRLWERLNFTRAGIIKDAGRLKGHEGYVDAYIYQYHFPSLEDALK